MVAPQPRRTQRLGAYAVLLRETTGVRQILLTRISPLGFPVGCWGLPGGGVDHGESPARGVVREVHEETGLELVSARLVSVHDVHTVAPGRDDRVEDYHGVHLLYAGRVDPHQRPEVTESDSTTDRAEWFDVTSAVRDRTVLPVVDHVLAHLDLFTISS